MSFAGQAAVFVPLRVNEERPSGDQLETLLTERAYWNLRKDCPMRYPGDFVFPGGLWEEGDSDLFQTGVREFREELGYDGAIHAPKFLRIAQPPPGNGLRSITYWSVALDERPVFSLPTDEVLSARWFTLRGALDWLHSEELAERLLACYEGFDLGNAGHGSRAVTEREFPIRTAETIEFMLESLRQETLIAHYSRAL